MYRAAVIGLGRMGSTFDDEIKEGGAIFLPYSHAASYRASPLTTLVAGADPHPEQRALFAERWGIDEAHLYADHREMLAAERLDIVSVTTTARVRASLVQDTARAGARAIWAEKPIAISLAEADAMVQVCREEGTALAINCARRWNPFFGQIKRLIEAGELGTLLQITAYTPCTLSHNGSHWIDLMRFLAGGEVAWVFGEMESDEAAAGDDDLMGNGYLAFANGVRGYLRGTPAGAASLEVDIIGEQGRVRSLHNSRSFEYTRTVAGGPRGRGQPAQIPFPLPTAIEGTGLAVVADLVHALETGQDPRCSGEDGRAALEVAIALRESHRAGGVRVDLPLADRSLAIRSSETFQDAVPARVRRLA